MGEWESAREVFYREERELTESEGQKSGREASAELLSLHAEWEEADKELIAAMERRDQAEVQRLRYRVSALMHDIAALRFDVTVEQMSNDAGMAPTGGPGWMGIVEGPSKNGQR